MRAQIRDDDLPFRYSGLPQLSLVRQRLIEVRLWPIWAAHERLGIANDFHDVFTHFVATRRIVGADHGDQIGRRNAVFLNEAVNGVLRDPGGGAPPSGMDRGNGAAQPIGNEDGNAIGGLNAQGCTPNIRHRRIAFKRFVCRPGVHHPSNDARMRLIQLQQRPTGHACGRQKARTVDLDGGIGGTVGSQCEFIVFGPPGGKRMDDPWSRLQGRCAKQCYLRNTLYV